MSRSKKNWDYLVDERGNYKPLGDGKGGGGGGIIGGRKGQKGEPGSDGDKGADGLKGQKGDKLQFSDLSPGDLDAIKVSLVLKVIKASRVKRVALESKVMA